MESLPVSSSSSEPKVHDASSEDESQSAHHETTIVDNSAHNEDKLDVFASDSEDEESESDDEDDYYEEEHGDHRDVVVCSTPWKNWVYPHGWPHDFMRILDLSKPNDVLLEDPDSRRWLRKLSQLEPKDLASLRVRTKGKPKIPLFKDESTGDEYQLYLHPGLRAGLATIDCPKAMIPSPENQHRWIPRADPLLQVRYRLRPADASGCGPNPIPEFIIPLGKLAVRTSLREQWQSLCSKEDPPPTEFTDYMVVIDAAHKDLAVWIIVSQSVLKDRMEFEGKDYPQLPVFRGAMTNDEYGFDTACILKSIHDLPLRDFDQACELVRNTRSVRDPRIMRIGAEKMAKLSGTELQDDWDGFMPMEIVTAEDVEKEVNH